jgi:hypothetical protein
LSRIDEERLHCLRRLRDGLVFQQAMVIQRQSSGRQSLANGGISGRLEEVRWCLRIAPQARQSKNR